MVLTDTNANEVIRMLLGNKIRDIRTLQNISQSDLAVGICSQPTISLLESGQQLPPPDILELIAKRLDNHLLAEYATLLRDADGTETLIAKLEVNEPTTLLNALRKHKGRLHPRLILTSVETCEHLYNYKLLDRVKELCELVINNYHEYGIEPDGAYGQLCFYYGSSLLFLPSYRLAIQWLKKAEPCLPKLPDTIVGRYLYNFSYAYSAISQHAKAIWYAHQASEKFISLRDYVGQGKSLALLGVLQGRLGMQDESMRSLTVANDLLERWKSNPADLARVKLCLADRFFALDDPESAMKLCQETLQLAAPLDEFITLSSIYRILCQIKMSEPECRGAEGLLLQANHYAEQSKDVWSICRTALLSIRVYDISAKSFQMVSRILDITTPDTYPAERGMACEFLSKYCIARHDQEKANYFLKESLAAYKAVAIHHTDLTDYMAYIDL